VCKRIAVEKLLAIVSLCRRVRLVELTVNSLVAEYRIVQSALKDAKIWA